VNRSRFPKLEGQTKARDGRRESQLVPGTTRKLCPTYLAGLSPALGAAESLGPRHFWLGVFSRATLPRCIAMVRADVLTNLFSRIFEREKCAVCSFKCFLETGCTGGFQRAYRIRVNSQLSIVPMSQHETILAHTALQAHRLIW